MISQRPTNQIQKVLVTLQLTTKRRRHQPGQVKVPVDTRPHASTEAELNRRRTKGKIGVVDNMVVAEDTNTIKVANMYYVQALKIR